MFIGQKKNMWRSRYENSTWTYSVVNEPIHTQADYFVDPCAHMLVENMEQDVMLSLSYTAE